MDIQFLHGFDIPTVIFVYQVSYFQLHYFEILSLFSFCEPSQGIKCRPTEINNKLQVFEKIVL